MTDIPYLRRRAQHKIGKPGRKSEKRLTKKFGGRETPASGAMPGAKGDISFDRILLEAKATTKDSLSVKFEWLAKITREARSENKVPALSVSFVKEDGTAVDNGDWVLVPGWFFKDHMLGG